MKTEVDISKESSDAMASDRFNCLAHFSNVFMGSSYYSAGRSWSDYAPAYAFGYDTYRSFQHRLFEDSESDLQELWSAMHGDSRLTWQEARAPVHETWTMLDTESAGPVDRASQRDDGA